MATTVNAKKLTVLPVINLPEITPDDLMYIVDMSTDTSRHVTLSSLSQYICSTCQPVTALPPEPDPVPEPIILHSSRQGLPINISTKSTTGYVAIEWAPNDVSVYGIGAPDALITSTKLAGYSGDNVIKIWSVNSNSATDPGGDLTILYAEENDITSADLTNAPKLIEVSLHTNKLPTLTVNHISDLEVLKCSSNLLTSLDVASNVKLKLLSCGHNNLSQLDISTLVRLEYLLCIYTQVQVLDFTLLTNLKYLYCYNNNLQSLNCDNSVYLIELNCRSNSIASLNVSYNTQLKLLITSQNKLSSLDITSCHAIEDLQCDNNLITLFVGVANKVKLKKLFAHYNANLSNLDLTGCSEMDNLQLNNCKFASLNIDDCVKLKSLSLQSNVLTGINLAHNIILETLNISFNSLSTISLTTNTLLTFFNVSSNQSLSIITVNSLQFQHIEAAFLYLCNLSFSAINDVFISLTNPAPAGGYVKASYNPGSSTCDQTLATVKGYTVVV